MGAMSWAIATAIFAILEIVIPGLVTIWLALAALIVTLLAGFINNPTVEFLIFSVFSLIFVIFTRPVLRRYIQKTDKNFSSQMKGSEIKIEKVKEWGIYPEGNLLGEAVPLFPRIEAEEEVESEYKEDLKIENPIAIDDFSKVEIKVVEIEKVSKVEGADKLLKFIVNTGKEKRQIISGIAKWYPNEQELVGKKVQAILNLKPVELKGELSQGMLLTATEKKKTKLIIIDDEIKIGTTVK